VLKLDHLQRHAELAQLSSRRGIRSRDYAPHLRPKEWGRWS
jgi:hypothetical protein